MMSGFGSYYLNLVSITFYAIPNLFLFSEKKVLKFQFHRLVVSSVSLLRETLFRCFNIVT